LSIKELFNKNKLLAQTSMDALTSSVESAGYVTEFLVDRDRIIPQVDFSDPSQFCKFGSAKKYYVDSIQNIYQNFPFDGSGKEKLEFYNSSSGVDLHVLNQWYPKFTGYAKFSPNGYGSVLTQSDGFSNPATKEYILVHGGPNTGSLGGYLGGNVYDTGSLRVSNLRFGGDYGNTVEFWLKKGAPVLASSAKEVIFDAWNNVSASHAAGSTYGRLLIYVDGQATLGTSCFKVSYVSGSVSVCTDYSLGTVALTASSVLNDTWNHYAFSFKNAGSDLAAKVYFNGALDSSVIISNGAINEVQGVLHGCLGSILTSSGMDHVPPQDLGWGKLSGSIDEFRFWKKERTLGDIGRYWFTQVNGGANSKDGNTSLGVYYKFNEGINSVTDNKVLDYSGRLSHGAFVGYTSANRSLDSAIDTYFSSSSAITEAKDPVVYSFHPDVVSLESEKALTGSLHDLGNSTSLYYSMPSWMIEEDEEKERFNLLNLTQIMGQYFDTLYMQISASVGIRDINYDGLSGSNKPYPFVNKMLQSRGFDTPEIFSNVSTLESLANRSDKLEFEVKLNDTKNVIYQNIYNNLSYIYKSKGTLNSIRNLIRCFGVDDELVRFNIYANNTTHLFNENFRTTSAKKKYVDFNNVDRFYGTVYQYSSSNNANSYSYLTSSGTNLEASGSALTAEANIIFPKKFEQSSPFYFETPFVSSSLFGVHTVKKSAASLYDTSWDSSDTSNFQVYAVKEEIDSKNVYFVLTSSTGGPLPRISSGLITNVYDNNQWTLAVKVHPEKYPIFDAVSGSGGNNFTVEFCGYNTILDTVVNSFSVSSSLTYAQGVAFLDNSKRFYVGAHKNNFTGSNLQGTDVRVGNFRVWLDNLSNEEILHHAYDNLNYGVDSPYRNISLLKNSYVGKEIPKFETLALNWNFELVTGSNASGQFQVVDISSGSSDNLNRYGWLSNVTEKQLEGRGDGFLSNDSKVTNVEYISRAKSSLPETIGDDDMIQILERDDETFTRDTRPTQFFYTVEKSMYQTISEEMVKMFASILDFNNLVGQPVNRYRAEYKDLAKLRQLFFERVSNTPEVEKYIDYFKWIDSSLMRMIKQLVPASAVMYDNVGDVIESHILERNKYQTKFPIVEFKHVDPIEGMKGINELKYDWKIGHAPLNGLQNNNSLYWKKRAVRTDPVLSSSVASVNDTRVGIFNNLLSTYERLKTTPYVFSGEQEKIVAGGANQSNQKSPTLLKNLVNTKGTYARVITSSFVDNNDYSDLGQKKKYSSQIINSATGDTSKGNILPFSIFSSSVTSGYNTTSNNLSVENLHNDSYLDGGEVPMQGPFTEQHVGGHQYRHNTLNTAGTASQVDRVEGFKLYPNASGYMDIYSGDTSGSNLYSNQLQKGNYLRDSGIKSPVNVRNIKGANFDKNYQVVQTSGRKTNNKAFVVSGGFANLVSASATVAGVMDYQLPDRGRNESVFVERFSCPGGPETAGGPNGGFGLDVNSAEYSVYNSYNYRNLRVRDALQTLLTRHAGQFGTDSLYGNVNSTYESSASYQKTNRNTSYVFTSQSNGTYLTASKYDNFFISHAIPANDRQYSWITSSAITVPFGYALNSDDIIFISSSVSSSATGISGVGNFVGVMSSSLTASDGLDLNLVLNNRGAAGRGWPSWKQIRSGDTQQARNNRAKNIIEVLDPSAPITTVKNGQMNTVQALRSYKISSYLEAPISSKFAPLTYNLKVNNDGLVAPLSLKVAFGNQVHSFGNIELANKLGIQATTPALYSRMLMSYADENIGGDNQVDSFESLKYSETVYPSDMFSYTGDIRSRKNYSVDYWTHAREHRNTVATNSQGYVVSQSVWGLDARSNFTSSMPQTGSVGSEGELQNLYSIYFATSSIDPWLAGNYVKSVTKFGYAYEVDGVPTVNAANITDYNDRLDAGPAGYWNSYVGYDGTNHLSISTWVNPIQFVGASFPNRQQIISWGTGSMGLTLATGSSATDTQVLFYTRWGVGAAAPEVYWVTHGTSLSYNNWHNIVAVFDKALMLTTPAVATKIYIDGALASTYGAPAAAYTTQQKIEGANAYIGNDWLSSGSHSSPLESYVSHTAIFSGSLTATQVSEIYNSGKPSSLYQHSARNSLISYWLMGDGVGTLSGSGVCGVVPQLNTFGSASLISDSLSNTGIYFDMAGLSYLRNTSDRMKNEDTYYNNGSAIDHTKVTPGKLILNSSLTSPLKGIAQVREPNWSANFKLGSLYARPEYVYENVTPWQRIKLSSSIGSNPYFREIHITSSKTLAGSAEFTANQGNNDPMFNSYSEYANDLRKYQDYSIVPSYNSSDRMDFYLNSKNFLEPDDEFLQLKGGTYSSSIESGMFKTYSMAEFLQYFEILKNDHAQSGDVKTLSLKCKAAIKLLPHDGFYPNQRVVQLAGLYSSSYGDYVRPYNQGDASSMTASFRSFLTPVCMPGILMNSLKASIATDHPIWTAPPNTFQDYKSGRGNYSPTADGWQDTTLALLAPSTSIRNREIFGSAYNAQTASFVSFTTGIGGCHVEPASLNSSSFTVIDPLGNDDGIEWQSVLFGNVSERIPFEALVAPENYLAKRPLYDIECDASASLRTDLTDPSTNMASFWGGEGKLNYRLAMSNFLASVPDFFLSEGKLTSFVSDPIPSTGVVITEEGANCYYGMDVSLAGSQIRSLSDWNARVQLPEFSVISNLFNTGLTDDDLNNIKGVHTQTYTRASAFGPPQVAALPVFTGSGDVYRYHYDYSTFTPSHFDAFSVARLLFFPYKGAGTYTLSEIQSHTTASYIRMPGSRVGVGALYKVNQLLELQTLIANDKNVLTPVSSSGAPRIYDLASQILTASGNWSQLSSSIDLFGVSKVKNASFDRGTSQEYKISSVSNDSPNPDYQWVISSKFESPVLNFKDASVNLPTYGSSSISRGLWHQAGRECVGNEGLWMSVSDLPSSPLTTIGCDESSGTCLWNGKSENVINIGNKNAEVILYVNDYTKLTDYYLYIDGTWMPCANALVPSLTLYYGYVGWENEVSNYKTCVNIAACINDVNAYGIGGIYNKSYNVVGSTDKLIGLDKRCHAEAFLPDIPSDPLNPVAAVRIKIIDVATPDTNYPEYYKSGNLGNSLTVSCTPDSSAWGFEGKSLTSDNIIVASEVRFHGGVTGEYKVKSFADLVKIKKESKRIGQVAEEKKIYEAVVAIPYIENKGYREFFTIPRRQVDIALGKVDAAPGESVGKSIMDMVTNMQKFVFPPRLDFVKNSSLDAFSMYIFPFSKTLNKQDLLNIFQGLMPAASLQMEHQELTMAHDLSVGELFNGDFQNCRWLIFKVKQKAAWDYYQTTPTSIDDNRFVFDFRTGRKSAPSVSYNWPFSECDLVELVKLDAGITIEGKKKI